MDLEDFNKWVAICCIIVYSNLLGFFTVRKAQQGQRLASGGLILLTAVVPMLGSWLILQRAQPLLPDGATFLHGSAAALIGDPFVITSAVMLAATEWKIWRWENNRIDIDAPSYYQTQPWQYGLILLVIGFPVGIYMHGGLSGSADSQSADLGVQLHDSATSWAHNLGVVPAIVTVLVCILWRIRTSKRCWFSVTVMAVGWGGLVQFDTWRAGLDPAHPLYFNSHWLDVVMDWSRLRPL